MREIAIRDGYGDGLVILGKKDTEVVVLDADLSNATKTIDFAKAYPERFFNIGVAEANMVNISVGMSCMNKIPFCSTFALFGAGRAYEQIRNCVAYPHANVKICCSHGGVTVGEDGGSHQAIEDFALMRVIPGMTVIVPCDYNEAVQAVQSVAEYEGPVYMRLGRSPSPVITDNERFEIGKAKVLKEGTDVVLFACGILVPTALSCAEHLAQTQDLDIAVVNVHTLKPIDAECVRAYARKCKKVMTLEEHSVIGGLGDAVVDTLLNETGVSIKKIGVQDRFGQSGTPEELLSEYGLDAEHVEQAILDFLND